MTSENEFEQLMNRYNELTESDDAAVSRFLDAELPKLSDEARSRFMREVLMTAIEDIVEHRETITAIAERGLKAIDQLDVMEREIEQEERS